MPDWLFILIAIISANLPWMSERFLLIFNCGEKGKRVWMRFAEWLILYFIIEFFNIQIFSWAGNVDYLTIAIQLWDKLNKFFI